MQTKNLFGRSAFTLILCILFSVSTSAEDRTTLSSLIQKRKDGILTLMGFTVFPDVTTSSLAIDNAKSDDTSLQQTTFGGGFTISDDFPLYLEGTAGYSRYQPTDMIDIDIPLKWNSFSLSGGIGWDFPLTENKELKLRPIFNFSLGRVESDASLLGYILEKKTDIDLEFLHRGTMNTYGLGGSLMLDWEHYREAYEIDVELRYSYMQLRSFKSEYSSIEGSSDANILSLWTRWRAPTGLTMLNKPLRYVIEGSNTTFLGKQRGALGFNYLTTIGIGLELDSSDYPVFITRTRLIGRYTFGENVSGFALGLAMSF
jgi:hypothetical protein